MVQSLPDVLSGAPGAALIEREPALTIPGITRGALKQSVGVEHGEGPLGCTAWYGADCAGVERQVLAAQARVQLVGPRIIPERQVLPGESLVTGEDAGHRLTALKERAPAEGAEARRSAGPAATQRQSPEHAATF
ncbi:MAG: hypothetical protein M0038_05620 [Pseudomonadota bacterium]|nr:hypothetical protein [Pseudomonadota bacterium]